MSPGVLTTHSRTSEKVLQEGGGGGIDQMAEGIPELGSELRPSVQDDVLGEPM